MIMVLEDVVPDGVSVCSALSMLESDLSFTTSMPRYRPLGIPTFIEFLSQ